MASHTVVRRSALVQMRRELKKERNIVEERKQLQRELQRSLLESKIRYKCVYYGS